MDIAIVLEGVITKVVKNEKETLIYFKDSKDNFLECVYDPKIDNSPKPEDFVDKEVVLTIEPEVVN